LYAIPADGANFIKGYVETGFGASAEHMLGLIGETVIKTKFLLDGSMALDQQ